MKLTSGYYSIYAIEPNPMFQLNHELDLSPEHILLVGVLCTVVLLPDI
jgi:hypothetical protein